MPLLKGKSKQVRAKNFSELRHGKTFAHTEAKFGKRDAEKQMVAIELGNERKPGKRKIARKKG